MEGVRGYHNYLTRIHPHPLAVSGMLAESLVLLNELPIDRHLYGSVVVNLYITVDGKFVKLKNRMVLGLKKY